MIGIIDYGAGNTRSIMNALDRLEAPYFLSSDSKELKQSDKLILPGVGHAKTAMNELRNRELIDLILYWEKPFLGVCLGMQLLASRTEEGHTICLGIIDEQICKFPSDQIKVPKMGWNTTLPMKDGLMENITEQDYFYFVHSYYLPSSKFSIANAFYGLEYAAAIRKDNYWGVQFHPEKSAHAGSKILQNFLAL